MEETRKIEKEKKEKYINGPREPDSTQQRKGARGPVANRSGIFSFSLISLTYGPYMSAPTPSSTSVRISRRRLFLPAVTPPLKTSLIPALISPNRSYKIPSRSSSISFSFPCRRLRQDGEISRRSFARLRASAHRFGAPGEPASPSRLLPSSLDPELHPDPSSSS
jgi:hypothetical protein